MLNLKAKIAVAAAVFAAAALPILGTAAPASAAVTGDTSTDWAGYFATTSAPIDAAGVSFTVPKGANCGESRGTPNVNGYQALMWVGIGGFNGAYGIKSGPLFQDGVEAYCAKLSNSTPVYLPWWEVYPGTPSVMTFTSTARISAGARITAQVYAPGEFSAAEKGEWTFVVTAAYPGHATTWTTHYKAPSSAKDYTAEVVTEREPHVPGFVDVGKVTYSSADYFTDNMDSLHSIVVTPVTLVNKGAAVVVPSSPSKDPDDGLKDSFSTSYAVNWLAPS